MDEDDNIIVGSVPYSYPLSSRAERFTSPPLKYVEYLINSFTNNNVLQSDDLYTYSGVKKDVANKVICLAVAENKLTHDVLLDKICSIKLNETTKESSLNYTSASGSLEFREILGKFMGNYLFHQEYEQKKVPYYPKSDELVIGPGCGGLLHELSVLLFEPNDSILVPTPYYPAFDHDFHDLGDVYTVEINMMRDPNKPFDNDAYLPYTIDALDLAYDKAIENNHPPKAILLTNPSNPLGITYSVNAIMLAIKWADKKRLHVIVDEIYGLSVYNTDEHSKLLPFISVCTLLENNLGENIHILWSLSKDFGCSGLRIGVVYSHNKTLIRALGGCNDAFQVASIAQDIMGAILSDIDFVDLYFKESRKRTLHSYHIITEFLQSRNIPYVKACAGMFVYVDFRSLLSAQTFQAEESLATTLFEDIGIILTPGKVCHCPYPGFFRLCFAWVQIDVLEIAIDRINTIITKIRGY